MQRLNPLKIHGHRNFGLKAAAILANTTIIAE